MRESILATSAARTDRDRLGEGDQDARLKRRVARVAAIKRIPADHRIAYRAGRPMDPVPSVIVRSAFTTLVTG
jgi:hypothetical protein